MFPCCAPHSCLKMDILRFSVLDSTPVSNTLHKPLTHQLQHLITRHIPERLVEDLDLDRASVAGLLHRRTDRADVDHAIAHHPAPQQHTWRWHQPIADVEGEYVPTR